MTRTDVKDTSPAWDIVFLITGKPLPAMLDMGYCAQNAGLRAGMVLLERGIDDLTIDQALVNFEIVTVDVPYKTVDLKRLLSLPATYATLRRIVSRNLKPRGIIVTGSYDLLLFGRLLAAGHAYRLRHQVRDLHALQLSPSLVSRALVAVEKLLLRRVEKIIVSSPAFITGYYSRLYDGQTVLLENVPSRSTWSGFRRAPIAGGCFRIGFIGILRYKESLRQLIDAVQTVAADGTPIKVVFAGGGSTDGLQEAMHRADLFEFRGPYEYTKDITGLYRDIDLIYSVYDGNDPNCQLAMPNKFYESIIAKIPILVARDTFLESEVLRLGIGASVRTGDRDELVALLRSATAGEGWYARALAQLAACDADAYFDAYQQAMLESVLP